MRLYGNTLDKIFAPSGSILMGFYVSQNLILISVILNMVFNLPSLPEVFGCLAKESTDGGDVGIAVPEKEYDWFMHQPTNNFLTILSRSVAELLHNTSRFWNRHIQTYMSNKYLPLHQSDIELNLDNLS